jgi:hypothetical protein
MEVHRGYLCQARITIEISALEMVENRDHNMKHTSTIQKYQIHKSTLHTIKQEPGTMQNIPMEEHMQNMQFHQEPAVVYDQKQHLLRHLYIFRSYLRILPSLTLS